MKEFTHMSDSPFPHLNNIDVYKYENNFDYTRWQPNTTIKLCSVAWCGDYDNVVKFENDDERDAWFNFLTGETITLESDFRLLPDGTIRLPIPFDVMVQYNYIVVDFPIATNVNNPIAFETLNSKRRYYFFIDDVKMLAPSTTEAIIHLDYWNMYINSVDITYMQLERGHAPMAEITADEYLKNPIEKCDYLLTPDVNVGDAERVTNTSVGIINSGDMFVCFATTANIFGNWGSKSNDTWEVADFSSAIQDGAPTNIEIFAVKSEDYKDFMEYIENTIPQFIPTVQGIFVASNKIINTYYTSSLGGIEIYEVFAAANSLLDIELTKDKFGFNEEYENIAKLYTYPYSHIELSDSEGNKTIVKIEETVGNVSIKTITNLAFPYISVEGILHGVGNGNINEIWFSNIDTKTFRFSGKWYDYIMRFNIPCYAVTQGMKENYDFSTYFNRKQQYDQNALTRNNIYRSGDTDYLNNEISLHTAIDNLTIARNHSETITSLNVGKTQADYFADYVYITRATNIENIATTATAAVNQAVGIGTGVVNSIGSAVNGNGVGAVVGLFNAGISAVGISATSNVVISTNTNLKDLTVHQNFEKNTNARLLANNVNETSFDGQEKQLEVNNFAAIHQSANTIGTMKDNADDVKNLADLGIQRNVAEAELQSPLRFGTATNASSATTKPIGVFANIVTQSKSAIKTAADNFLRYGYYLNQNWKVTDLNVMPHFSFWKASEIWLAGEQDVIEDAQQMIKKILLTGVTVWRNPDEIGTISIYDNERGVI